MNIVKCSCPFCFEENDVSEDLKSYICPSCNNKVTVNEAIHMYNSIQSFNWNEGIKLRYDRKKVCCYEEQSDCFVIKNNVLLQCTTDFEIVLVPDNITEIGKGAFANNTYIKGVYLPISVKKIGNNAFSNCDKLNLISLPYMLEYIGDDAFNGCRFLELGWFYSPMLNHLGDRTFAGCEYVTRFKFGKNMTYTGSNIFDKNFIKSYKKEENYLDDYYCTCTVCYRDFIVSRTLEVCKCDHCDKTVSVNDSMCLYNYRHFYSNTSGTASIMAYLNTNSIDKDFIIENGELLQYNGNDKIVNIPETVNKIGASVFEGNKTVTNVFYHGM